MDILESPKHISITSPKHYSQEGLRVKTSIQLKDPALRSRNKLRVYVKGILSRPHEIHQYRDEIRWGSPIDQEIYTESEAHITIFPSFTTTQEGLITIEENLQKLEQNKKPIEFNTLGVWPNLHNPRTIFLDTAVDLSNERSLFKKIFEKYGGSISKDPTKPHVTLLNADTESWTLNTSLPLKEYLQEKSLNYTGPSVSQVKELSVKVQSPQ